MSKLTRYLKSVGFTGVVEKPIKNYLKTEARAAGFETVNTLVFTKHFNRPVCHDSKKGKFYYKLGAEKAVVVDINRNLVVLANTRALSKKLRSKF